MEVILGKQRRRWSDEDKRRIVAETFAPGAVCLEVARRHQLSTGMLFTWRRRLRAALGFPEGPTPAVRFAPLGLIADATTPARRCASAAIIEIDLAGTARVTITGAAPADLVVAVLKTLARR